MTQHSCGHHLTSPMVFFFADSPSHCPSLSHCLPGKSHLPLLVYALLQSQTSPSTSPQTCTFNSLLDILKFILSKDQPHPFLPSPPATFSSSIPSSSCLSGKLHSQGILHSFIHSHYKYALGIYSLPGIVLSAGAVAGNKGIIAFVLTAFSQLGR